MRDTFNAASGLLISPGFRSGHMEQARTRNAVLVRACCCRLLSQARADDTGSGAPLSGGHDKDRRGAGLRASRGSRWSIASATCRAARGSVELPFLHHPTGQQRDGHLGTDRAGLRVDADHGPTVLPEVSERGIGGALRAGRPAPRPSVDAAVLRAGQRLLDQGWEVPQISAELDILPTTLH